MFKKSVLILMVLVFTQLFVACGDDEAKKGTVTVQMKEVS